MVALNGIKHTVECKYNATKHSIFKSRYVFCVDSKSQVIDCRDKISILYIRYGKCQLKKKKLFGLVKTII